MRPRMEARWNWAYDAIGGFPTQVFIGYRDTDKFLSVDLNKDDEATVQRKIKDFIWRLHQINVRVPIIFIISKLFEIEMVLTLLIS